MHRAIRITLHAALALVACAAVGMLLDFDGGLMLAVATATTSEAATKLRAVVEKMTTIANEWRGKAMPADKHTEFTALATEAEQIKAGIDADERTNEMKRWLTAVPDPILPVEAPEQKGQGDDAIAGYVSIGNMAGMSEQLRAYKAAGLPRTAVEVLSVDRLVRLDGERTPYVAVTKGQWQQMLQRKAVPDAAVLIMPDRRTRIIQATPDTRLRISDVLAQGRTTSNSVEWMIESSYTNAAAEVADNLSGNDVKPESSLVYTEESMTVRTIAHHMPVFNQQLEDIPQLQSLIENRLLYGLDKRKERQVVWADGIAPNLKGLMAYAIPDIAANGRFVAGTHQLLDAIRMGVTDITVAGYEPNAVLLHPFDWESAVLLKDDEKRYLWVVVTDATGPRLWSLRVVETTGVQADDGDPIERRIALVGDFLRGAQETTRTDAAITVGLIDKQFVQNKRTILAETRLVLEVYAPAAFAYYETEAAALS